MAICLHFVRLWNSPKTGNSMSMRIFSLNSLIKRKSKRAIQQLKRIEKRAENAPFWKLTYITVKCVSKNHISVVSRAA